MVKFWMSLEVGELPNQAMITTRSMSVIDTVEIETEVNRNQRVSVLVSYVVKQTTWRRNVNNAALILRKMSIQRERIFTLKSLNRKKSNMCHHQGDGVWIAVAPCTCVPTKMQ